MSPAILSNNYPSYPTNAVPAGTRPTAQTGTVASLFLDRLAGMRQASGGTVADAATAHTATATGTVATFATQAADAYPVDPDAYKAYLEKRFGPVTIQSIPKDQASLEAAGKRMSGSDVVIAPNIFEEMVADPQIAVYYEQKISYFFTDVIPKGEAFAASVGLTFEPCGVVIHEDGTVTYICGGGDPPERVAEVNRINREKAAKKAAQQRQRQAQAAEAAVKSKAMQVRATSVGTGESDSPSFPVVSDLLRTQMLSTLSTPSMLSMPSMTSVPAVASLLSLPTGVRLVWGPADSETKDAQHQTPKE